MYCQDGSNAGDKPQLDPAVAKVMEVMTANITSAIDNKLDCMLHRINDNISQHLSEIGDWFNEAEGRILAAENTAVETEKQVASLMRSVRELTEHLQDQENRGPPKESEDPGIRREGGGQRRSKVYGSPGSWTLRPKQIR